MEVPFLDLNAQYAPIRKQVREAVLRVVDSQQFILGPEGRALERELADYCGCAEAVGLSSGSDALLVALMAGGVGPGDEVITTSYSFFATAGSIARLGAVPVFVDIDYHTFNIDPAAIEARVTPRTRAIVAVHLFGLPANMDPVLELADHHGLLVIEDAAQSIGAELRGKRCGSIGHLGCFSFYPTKNLGGCGEGGMLTTDDPRLAEKARKLRNHGFSQRYQSELVGGNYRLDEIQAAVLRVKLPHLESWTRKRRQAADQYRKRLAAARLSPNSNPDRHSAGQQQSGQEQRDWPVYLPAQPAGRRHVYHQFVIRVQARDPLQLYLREHRIGTDIYYPVPLHLSPCFKSLGYRRGDLPASERSSRRSLALPIYPELTAEKIQFVVDTIAQFYSDSNLVS